MDFWDGGASEVAIQGRGDRKRINRAENSTKDQEPKGKNHPKVISHLNAASFTIKQNSAANMAHAEYQQGCDLRVKDTVAAVETWRADLCGRQS